MLPRKKTNPVAIGDLVIGGNSPILVQSMCNLKTIDTKAVFKQIKKLAKSGCEAIRLAIKDKKDLLAFDEINQKLSENHFLIQNKKIKMPLIADIHFDIKLAYLALEAGADKIRINPGNTKNFFDFLSYAKQKAKAVRIGFNSGSSLGFDFDLLDYLKDKKYDNIVISAKSSSILETIENYQKIAKLTDLPLHLGITEAGTAFGGSIKSSLGLGILLNQGLGDTIRVSLSGDPAKEISVAYKILNALEIRKRGIEMIVCPTCSRTDIDVEKIALKIEKKLNNIEKNISIAVMGCAVNGPGEAKNADFGIAGGIKEGLIFSKGKIIKKVKEENLLVEFLKIIKKNLKSFD